MKYNQIPNTDLHVSAISLGTWVFSGDVWGAAEEKDCLDAMAAASDAGINMIDTAPVYGWGRAETIVGKAIHGRRHPWIIATKCGLVKGGRGIVNDLSPASVRREIDESLQRLQIERIDLYQCHWPDPQTSIESTMEEMLRIQKQGKIRYIGVSNFDKALLARARKVAPVVTVQNQYSMVERGAEEELFPYCREQSIGVFAYGPLAGGVLTGKYREAPRFKGGDARSFFYKYYSGPAFDNVKTFLNHLAELKRPWGQLAINWVRQQPGVTSVLVGGRNAIQVRDNAAATEWDLTSEEIQRIREWIGHDLHR